MNDIEFLKELIEQAKYADTGYFEYAHIIACRLDKRLHEQLRQLVNGPVYDGNVICKTDRDELLSLGLATRVCCAGEQGHTGAVYLAYSVIKIIDQIKSGKIGA